MWQYQVKFGRDTRLVFKKISCLMIYKRNFKNLYKQTFYSSSSNPDFVRLFENKVKFFIIGRHVFD